jgi:hypothetical protein
MGIIELPEWRLRQPASDRTILRSGLAESRPVMRVVKTFDHASEVIGSLYCDRCAAPIEFGAVTNGLGTYCSVECSLEGPIRPA